MSEPYFVEVDENGCSHCGKGRMYRVTGPDDIGSSTSYENEEDAEHEADILNVAYAAGASVKDAELALQADELQRLEGENAALRAENAELRKFVTRNSHHLPTCCIGSARELVKSIDDPNYVRECDCGLRALLAAPAATPKQEEPK